MVRIKRKKINYVAPMSINEFESKFPETCEFSRRIQQIYQVNNKDCAVVAPVKSGKRRMVEYLAMKSFRGSCIEPSEWHFYVTALNRKDTLEQIEELKSYGVVPLIIARQKNVDDAINQFSQRDGVKIVHFDESDYGTDKEQLLSKVYSEMKLHDPRFVFYSATNEEVLFSTRGKNGEIIHLDFTPNASYRGAEWFLQNDLVLDSTPFCTSEGLTTQGREACEYFFESDKLFSVLRDVGQKGSKDKFEDNKVVRDELYNNYGIECVYIDGPRPFLWESDYRDFLNRPKYVKIGGKDYPLRYLLIICQTCSRSTEVGFHKHICFWHDHRSTASYTTMAQAALRVAHYDAVGHKIRIYNRKEVFELSSGRISYDDYGDKLSVRITKSRGNKLSEDPNDYKVYKFESEKELRLRAQDINHNQYNSEGHFISRHGINIIKTWKKDDDGRYLEKIHNIDKNNFRVYDIKDVESNKFWGLGDVLHRVYACYDKGKLVFYLIVHNGKKDRGISSKNTLHNS